ncbi:hypothetical protein [Algoriphagus mannitolivorans]|uniref:hypothetical protein n=1 Tax=Algoriphagus mannitolivorans TaxID=226504 RepID=UPI000429D772|nr:hypothetical protein [Algoriphagus mannitolivorans]
MLHAIHHNKIPRALFRGNEDSLTAAVFERLRYLPKELLHHVINHALYRKIPGLDLYQMENMEFWPNWDPSETSNSIKVEPDIFIRTPKTDVIIEAKRYDRYQQYSGQWRNQIQAYQNEYGEEGKDLIYIALGGIHELTPSTLEVSGRSYLIYKSDWSQLLQAIKEVKINLEYGANLLNTNHSILRILDDLILCFSMYGFSTSDGFDRFFPPSKINFIPQSLQILKTWTK